MNPSPRAESQSHEPIHTRVSLLVAVRDPENQIAWKQFVEIYTPLVYGHCIRRGLQGADAADVSQETMKALVQALQHFHYDRTRGSFRSWLLTVARSKLNNFFAKSMRQAQSMEPDHLQAQADTNSVWSAPDEDRKWEEEYRARLLEWASQQVEPMFATATWKAFYLSAIQHVPVAEIALQLGLSLGAVYIAKSRVAAKLREKIQEASEEDIFLG